MRARPAVLAMVAVCFAALAGQAARAAEFTVQPTSIEELKAVFGEVRSRHLVPARTRIGGTIMSISVTEGTEVTKGQLIARIVDDKIALQIDAADANIKAISSQLDNASVQLERTKRLFDSGAATKASLDQGQMQVDVLSNQLAAAKANRDVLNQQAAEGDTLAPEDGRVIAVPVTLGSVVLPGDTIATVAGGGYFLRLSLPERHATEITEGGTVLVGGRVLSAAAAVGDAPDPTTARKGKLVKVYPEITDGRVQADVEVEGLGTYFVGERTLVWVPVAHRQVLAVPRAAVTTRHGVDYVRLAAAGANKDPIDVAVILGETFERDGVQMIEILTGLQPGDRVQAP
jgi:RND family efflux transporter MFP subunit